jgi:hypothetical protein
MSYIITLNYKVSTVDKFITDKIGLVLHPANLTG